MLSLLLINPKSPTNVGAVMRAAGCYGVDEVFYTGNRYERARKFATDTKQRVEQIPLKLVDDLAEIKRENQKVVAVELIDGATPLPHFEHAEDTLYVFGPEDGSLQQALLDECDAVVYVPTNGCMNLGATANVLLYDRLAKSSTTNYSREFLLANRDVNNRAQFKSEQTEL